MQALFESKQFQNKAKVNFHNVGTSVQLIAIECRKNSYTG